VQKNIKFESRMPTNKQAAQPGIGCFLKVLPTP
jgi:hypothetical protein